MNYLLFCYILNDNLAFEFSDRVTPELREEWLQDWYSIYKGTSYLYDDEATPKDKVIAWMRNHFSETSFDTHNFQLKIRSEWIAADIKPPQNLGVLVFIPGEDNHMTTGMWDVSNEWVLLDEYRVPTCEVTHWQLLPEPPTPRA